MSYLYDSIIYFYFIPIIICFTLFKNKSIEINTILIYFEMLIIIDIVAILFKVIYKHNFLVFQYSNLFYYPLGVILILTQIESKKIKKLSFFAIFLYLIVISIYNIQIGQFAYPKYSDSFGGFLVCSITLYYYFEIFKNEKKENLTQDGMFWIISSCFFYTCGVFFLNLTYDKILDGKISFLFDTLNIVLTYLYTFVTIIGLILIYKKEKTKNKSLNS